MVKNFTKASDRRIILAQFPRWMDLRLPKQIFNIQALRSVLHEAMLNPVLEFTIPLAMNQIVEHSCLRVVEAWELLNDELAHQKRRTLGTKNADFVNLKRIRNKLIAHRIPNELNGKLHRKWYLKKYGSFDSVMVLIQRVGAKISERIQKLQLTGLLPSDVKLRKPVTVFDGEYVMEMVAWLKQGGMA